MHRARSGWRRFWALPWRRKGPALGALAAPIILVAIVVPLVLGSSDGNETDEIDSRPTASATPTATATPTSTPTLTSTPSPTRTAAPAPTEPPPPPTQEPQAGTSEATGWP